MPVLIVAVWHNPLYFVCRLVKWEDTVPAESASYAPAMKLAGIEHLVQCSQKRQLRTIVSAIKGFEISNSESQQLLLLHVSHAANLAPGQLDVAFLESLGFRHAVNEASQQRKVTTVLAINKPHVTLAAAVKELVGLRSLRGTSLVQKGPMHYLVLQCGAERLGMYTRQEIQQTFTESKHRHRFPEPIVHEVFVTAPSSQCNHADSHDDEPSDEDMPDASLQGNSVHMAAELAGSLHPYMVVAFKLGAKRKQSCNPLQHQSTSACAANSMASQEAPSTELKPGFSSWPAAAFPVEQHRLPMSSNVDDDSSSVDDIPLGQRRISHLGLTSTEPKPSLSSRPAAAFPVEEHRLPMSSSVDDDSDSEDDRPWGQGRLSRQGWTIIEPKPGSSSWPTAAFPVEEQRLPMSSSVDDDSDSEVDIPLGQSRILRQGLRIIEPKASSSGWLAAAVPVEKQQLPTPSHSEGGIPLQASGPALRTHAVHAVGTGNLLGQPGSGTPRRKSALVSREGVATSEVSSCGSLHVQWCQLCMHSVIVLILLLHCSVICTCQGLAKDLLHSDGCCSINGFKPLCTSFSNMPNCPIRKLGSPAKGQSLCQSLQPHHYFWSSLWQVHGHPAAELCHEMLIA